MKCLVLALLLAAEGLAQNVSGSLSGVVHDPGGAVVAALEIKLTSAGTGFRHSTSTNQEGFFSFPNLIPGIYQLSITAPGFKQYSQSMIELSAGHEIAVPHVGGFDQPLAAVYQISVLPHVEALLGADRLRPAYLFPLVRTRRVTADELTDVDPELQSLANVNSPEEYRAILERAGLSRRVPGALGEDLGTPEEEPKPWPTT